MQSNTSHKVPKLDSNAFLKDEESAIADYAFAIGSVLEGAAAFVYAVEKMGFSPATLEAFHKNLKRCINAIGSAVPNQYKSKVWAAITETALAAEEAEQAEAAAKVTEPTVTDAGAP